VTAPFTAGDCATGEVTIAIPPDGDGRQAIAGLAIDGHSRLIACDIDGGQIFVSRRQRPLTLAATSSTTGCWSMAESCTA
jgi:hypothetical protein